MRPSVIGALRAIAALSAVLAAISVISLAPAASLSAGGAVPWALQHTPDGQPDLRGYWTNSTFTPLERPAELAGKEFMTEAEAAAYEKKRQLQEESQAKDDIHYDNVIWQKESYDKVVTRRRTSIVVDPPDGKIPSLTPIGQQRAAARAEASRTAPSDSAASRGLGERCISWGNEGPPMLGSTYNANLQIMQTSRHFVIRHEMVHGVRMIPLDGTPHLGSGLRQLLGDSRGRWDGNTLIVDTTNFTDATPFRGPPATARQDINSSRDLHVVERFTRTDASSILYQFTVEDPSTWTKPWSGEIVMRKWEGPIFEYACHEGNYGLGFILSAARVQERQAPQ
jgi:hypothetical protein